MTARQPKPSPLDLIITEAVTLAINTERDVVRAKESLQSARVALVPGPIGGAMRALETASFKAATARKNLLAAVAAEGAARA